MKIPHLLITLILLTCNILRAQTPELRSTITTAEKAGGLLINQGVFPEPLITETKNFLVVQTKNASGRMAWGKIKITVPGINIPIILTVPASLPSNDWETIHIVSLVGFYLRAPDGKNPLSAKWVDLEQK